MYLHLQNQNNMHRKADSTLIHAENYKASQPRRLLSERVEYKQYTMFITVVIITCFHINAEYLQVHI